MSLTVFHFDSKYNDRLYINIEYKPSLYFEPEWQQALHQVSSRPWDYGVCGDVFVGLGFL